MANEVILQISSKLKDYRKSKGITIQQLADKIEPTPVEPEAKGFAIHSSSERND